MNTTGLPPFPDRTDNQPEQPGKEGTLGGNPPLPAKAGVQKPGPGGVLTATPRDDRGDDEGESKDPEK